jgi:hypothetical protein
VNWTNAIPVVLMLLPVAAQIAGNHMPLRVDPDAKVSDPFGQR